MNSLLSLYINYFETVVTFEVSRKPPFSKCSWHLRIHFSISLKSPELILKSTSALCILFRIILKLRYSEILYWTLNVSWTASYELTLVLTLWVPEELKNSIFEMPIITQTLIINNLRTTSAKSVNLNFIRKLVEYSFKNVLAKAMFILTVFEAEHRERKD